VLKLVLKGSSSVWQVNKRAHKRLNKLPPTLRKVDPLVMATALWAFRLVRKGNNLLNKLLIKRLMLLMITGRRVLGTALKLGK
jgi:hypothetical protein